MYGLRTVRGVIDVRCLEFRGVRFSEVCNVLAERYFQSVICLCPLYGACPLLGGSVMRGSTVYLIYVCSALNYVGVPLCMYIHYLENAGYDW